MKRDKQKLLLARLAFLVLAMASVCGAHAQKVVVYECLESYYGEQTFPNDIGRKMYMSFSKDKCVEWAVRPDGTYYEPDEYPLLTVLDNGTRVYQYRAPGSMISTTYEVSRDKSRITRIKASDNLPNAGIITYRKISK